MGGDQMLGALGDRRLQRLVGGPGGAERILQFPARAAGRHRQDGGEDQNQHDAGEIDRQQEHPVGFGFGAPREEQPALFRHRLFEVSGDRSRRRAVLPADECCGGGVVSRVAEPDQLAIDGNLALHQRLGALRSAAFQWDWPCTASISAASAGRIVSLASRYSLANSLIAGQCEGPRRALRPAQQRAHVGDFREYSERAVDGSVIGPRLEVQTDRGSADNEEDSEANSKDDALRGHCRLLTSRFRVARGSFRCGDALIDRRQQRVRREGLAQAACRAELEGHPQKIRCAFGVGEGVARHCDDRYRPACARGTSGSLRNRAYAA